MTKVRNLAWICLMLSETLVFASDVPAWKKMLQDYDAKMRSHEISPLSVVDAAYLKKGETAYFGTSRKWDPEKPKSGAWVSASFDGQKISLQSQSGKSLAQDLLPVKKMKLDSGLWIAGQSISSTEVRIKIHDPSHPMLKSFKKLEFYPYSANAAVEAKLILVKPYKKFTFTTVRERTQEFWAVGEVMFRMDGKEVRLPAYVAEDELKLVKEIFVPFKDPTNGAETYGGGRYVDAEFKTPQNLENALGEMNLVVDLNHAYQPFCAFSKHYNCVRVPGKPIAVAIRAGEKIGTHNLKH